MTLLSGPRARKPSAPPSPPPRRRSRFPLLTVAGLCLYLAAALFAEAVHGLAVCRDEVPAYNQVRLELRYLPPLTHATAADGTEHFFLMGSDNLGRDVFRRLLQGARIAFHVGVVSSLIAVPFGALLGLIAGYFGGKTDIILQRIIEIWDSMPQMFILIIVASVFMPTFWTLLFILLLFSWTELTGMVRAEFLRARNFEYVKAAKAIGVGNFRIILRHILPNALVTTVTFVPFILAGAIVALTALDFLGLGLGHEYPSLGDLVRQGKDNLQAPWIGLSIFFVLSILLTALIFIGEGVRDAMDKRRR